MDLLEPGDPRQVGRFRLIGRLGGGGMGRVFLGVSPGGRQVAVKLIHSELAGDKQFRERFAREIDAARRVGGFHTAPVIDADPDADPPWMVTLYIPGPSLSAAVAARGPLGLDQMRRLGAELAEGLAAIHGCGLVHRDLKPSNVVLAEDGPRIIDFGIARAAGDSRITTTGFIIGTYSYMSPEQVRGEVAGPASDVFSLGGTLTFAATARGPFGDDSIAAVVRRIISEPPDLTGLPDERGFRQLISECLAKSPDGRPSLADIVTRLTEPGGHAAALPIPGPIPGPADLQRSGRRASRRTVLITAGVAVIALLAAGLGILLSGGRPKPAPPASAPSSPAATASAKIAPTAPEATFRDPGGKNVFGVAFGSNTVLATGDSDGSTYLWNAATGKLVATLRDPASYSVSGVAYSPAHDVFAASDSNGSVYLWDAATHERTAILESTNNQDNNSVAVSPDGHFVAAGNAGGSTDLWDLAHGKPGPTPTATFHDPGGKSVYGIAFSRVGGLLAAGDTDGRVYLWNVASGKLKATLRDPDSHGLYDVAFSPDGRLIAVSDIVSGNSGAVYLWNAATGKLAATLPSNDGSDIADIAFSPDGRFLAAADTLGSVILWNVATGTLLADLPAPLSQSLIAVAFSPDGRTIATTNTGGRAYLWNASWLGS